MRWEDCLGSERKDDEPVPRVRENCRQDYPSVEGQQWHQSLIEAIT